MSPTLLRGLGNHAREAGPTMRRKSRQQHQPQKWSSAARLGLFSFVFLRWRIGLLEFGLHFGDEIFNILGQLGGRGAHSRVGLKTAL